MGFSDLAAGNGRVEADLPDNGGPKFTDPPDIDHRAYRQRKGGGKGRWKVKEGR